MEFSASQLCKVINSDLKKESKSVLNGLRVRVRVLYPALLVQSGGAELAVLDQGSDRAASGPQKGGDGRGGGAGGDSEPHATCYELTSFILLLIPSFLFSINKHSLSDTIKM